MQFGESKFSFLFCLLLLRHLCVIVRHISHKNSLVIGFSGPFNILSFALNNDQLKPPPGNLVSIKSKTLDFRKTFISIKTMKKTKNVFYFYKTSPFNITCIVYVGRMKLFDRWYSIKIPLNPISRKRMRSTHPLRENCNQDP